MRVMKLAGDGGRPTECARVSDSGGPDAEPLKWALGENFKTLKGEWNALALEDLSKQFKEN